MQLYLFQGQLSSRSNTATTEKKKAQMGPLRLRQCSEKPAQVFPTTITQPEESELSAQAKPQSWAGCRSAGYLSHPHPCQPQAGSCRTIRVILHWAPSVPGRFTSLSVTQPHVTQHHKHHLSQSWRWERRAKVFLTVLTLGQIWCVWSGLSHSIQPAASACDPCTTAKGHLDQLYAVKTWVRDDMLVPSN